MNCISCSSIYSDCSKVHIMVSPCSIFTKIYNCDFSDSGMAAVLLRFRSWILASWTDLVSTSSYVTRCRSAFDDDQESARIYVDIHHTAITTRTYSVFVYIQWHYLQTSDSPSLSIIWYKIPCIKYIGLEYWVDAWISNMRLALLNY